MWRSESAPLCFMWWLTRHGPTFHAKWTNELFITPKLNNVCFKNRLGYRILAHYYLLLFIIILLFISDCDGWSPWSLVRTSFSTNHKGSVTSSLIKNNDILDITILLRFYDRRLRYTPVGSFWYRFCLRLVFNKTFGDTSSNILHLSYLISKEIKMWLWNHVTRD